MKTANWQYSFSPPRSLLCFFFSLSLSVYPPSRSSFFLNAAQVFFTAAANEMSSRLMTFAHGSLVPFHLGNMRLMFLSVKDSLKQAKYCIRRYAV